MAHQLNYSALDRLLHRVAFAAPFVQLTAADVEKVMCGSSYDAVRAERPIVITSLPRAGTTLMLEATGVRSRLIIGSAIGSPRSSTCCVTGTRR